MNSFVTLSYVMFLMLICLFTVLSNILPTLGSVSVNRTNRSRPLPHLITTSSYEPVPKSGPMLKFVFPAAPTFFPKYCNFLDCPAPSCETNLNPQVSSIATQSGPPAPCHLFCRQVSSSEQGSSVVMASLHSVADVTGR